MRLIEEKLITTVDSNPRVSVGLFYGVNDEIVLSNDVVKE